MSKRGWIITKDYLAEPGEKAPSNLNAEGMMGPRDVTYSAEELKAKGKFFRMFDDDGELYYEGFLIGDESGPLDDFGCPNAGATEIRILEGPKSTPQCKCGETWRVV